MEKTEQIHVQVCYAQPDIQLLRDLDVIVGTTLHQAITQSGVLQEIPEIDLSVQKTGIYGKLKPLETVLREHDRVEIYRPLIADPKESRRQRADKKTRK